MAWLSHQERLGQDEFSDRHQPADVLRGNESVLETLTQRMLQNLFLKERDHLLSQARAELNRNTKWNLSVIVLVSFSNKLVLNDWIWRTPITDMLNLDENKFDCKKSES